MNVDDRDRHGFTLKSVYWVLLLHTATGLHTPSTSSRNGDHNIVAGDVKKGKHLQRVEAVGNYRTSSTWWIFLFPFPSLSNFSPEPLPNPSKIS
ncbi:MAG: hypothetical protein H7A53_06115 [Akkermansiaceae bacterium]|nr:hypothetical protein [Akkermansiaceae bacterium]